METQSPGSLPIQEATVVIDRGKSAAQFALQSVEAKLPALLISASVVTLVGDFKDISALAVDSNPGLPSSQNGLALAHKVLLELFYPNGLGNDKEVAAFGDGPFDEASIGDLLKAWITHRHRFNAQALSAV